VCPAEGRSELSGSAAVLVQLADAIGIADRVEVTTGGSSVVVQRADGPVALNHVGSNVV
jgi:hypothetical protein